VFNAIHAGLAHGMKLLVPVEEETRRPVRLEADAEGDYYLPACTGEEQLKRSGQASVDLVPMEDLLREAETEPDCVGLILNPGGRKLVLSRKMIRAAREHRPKSRYTIVKGSVVDMHVGAIVNAANTSLLGGGGVDGAIHRAAGPGLLEECRTLNGCPTGGAKITGAHNIRHADRIIHAVGPIYRGREEDARLLASCYRRSLDLALEHGLTSVAFPCISTGAYGYPLREAAEIAVRTVTDWFGAHPEVVMNVYFCCFRDEELEVYSKLVQSVRTEGDCPEGA